jgi:hypothetical protein
MKDVELIVLKWIDRGGRCRMLRGLTLRRGLTGGSNTAELTSLRSGGGRGRQKVAATCIAILSCE